MKVLAGRADTAADCGREPVQRRALSRTGGSQRQSGEEAHGLHSDERYLDGSTEGGLHR